MLSGDNWTTPQVGWGALISCSRGLWSGALFNSNGTEQFVHDWKQGDVITHTPSSANSTSVRWTCPIDGSITISGDVWHTRNIGRYNEWEIYKNGILLTEGQVGSGMPDSSYNPSTFLLSSIFVAKGDVIELRLTKCNSQYGDYVGVGFKIIN
jgi:hypothetical protein